MTQLLDGKVALVTGASRGIGRAISLALSAAGAAVALISRTKDMLAEVQAEITSRGGRAEVYPCDIQDAVKVAETVKAVALEMGGLHILVNNAGVTRDSLIMRMSAADWAAPLNTNLTGAFNCLKAVTRPMMKQRWGRIINITSVVGVTGNAGQANYAASKAGLIGLTKSAAKELASRGITVNAVAPGYITTDMTAGLTEEIKLKMTESIPLGRLGTPDDIAPAVVFLASEEAGYISGQTLLVDGGMVM